MSVGAPQYLAVLGSLGRGGAAEFGWDLNLVGHDAPAVQHLGAGPLQLLQDLGQLGVVVARRAPAEHPRQVVARAQGQHPQLALKHVHRVLAKDASHLLEAHSVLAGYKHLREDFYLPNLFWMEGTDINNRASNQCCCSMFQFTTLPVCED